MRRDATAQHGFTLLEIIVVLAVLGSLAAILTPIGFGYIEDANIRRAGVDANRLAIAINKMYTDSGRWPFYADGDGPSVYTAGTDAAVLTSNAVCSGGSCTDDALPSDSTGGATWDLAGDKLDNLRHHLITNTPFGSTDAAKDYVSLGARAWKGPYVDRIPDTDPWQRSYVVNVSNLDPQIALNSLKWVVVLSAGPNGAIETSADALMSANPAPAGDDIVARVR